MKKSHENKMLKVTEWYEANADKQEQTFSERLTNQKKLIDCLREENAKLKDQNRLLKSRTVTDGVQNRSLSTSLGGTSVVAQAVSSIVGISTKKTNQSKSYTHNYCVH